MKILIHSNAPWVGSGYGKQTRLLIPRMIKDGHEVIVSAISGLHGGEIEWVDSDLEHDGVLTPIRVLPAGQYNFGVDTLPAYIEDERPDLVLTVMDSRMLGPVAQNLRTAPLACWVPADCAPLSKSEEAFLRASAAVPIGMTRWGEKQLREAGLPDVTYIPHAVDTAVFTRDHDDPSEPKRAERRALGIDEDAFVIGMVAANSDAIRKGFTEQFAAFQDFHSVNSKAHLVVHTIARSQQGLPLEEIAMDFGIADHVSFSHPLPQVTGRLPDSHMARLYRSFDVLSNCSFAEGFGVPMIEAMACGVPVITTNDEGAMLEVGKPGFHVDGQPFWNPVHKGWWTRPDIEGIVTGYRYFAGVKGHGGEQRHATAAREHACNYDIDVVYNDCWRPFLQQWEAERA